MVSGIQGFPWHNNFDSAKQCKNWTYSYLLDPFIVIHLEMELTMRTITWKLHLKSDPKAVFGLLTTDAGRKTFWAEKAIEENGIIHFVFPNGQIYDSQITGQIPNKELCLDYFDSSVKFLLAPAENWGTDLTLINENVPESDFAEVNAGWVSLLMNLKAVADFQCDLRNHDPKRTWGQGYADN